MSTPATPDDDRSPQASPVGGEVVLTEVTVRAGHWREVLESDPGTDGASSADGPGDDGARGGGPTVDAVVLAIGPSGPGERADEIAERYGIDLRAELAGDRTEGGPAAKADTEAEPAAESAPASAPAKAPAAPAAPSATPGPGRPGTVTRIPLPRTLPGVEVPWSDLPATLLVVSTGETERDLRKAGFAVGRALAGKARALVVADVNLAPELWAAWAAGLWRQAFRLPSLARTPGGRGPVDAVDLVGAGTEEDLAPALRTARESVAATHRARLLTATRSNVKNPQWMARAAQQLVAELPDSVRARVHVDVQDEARLAERGAGAILAVGGGSPTPPRLVTVTYRPEGTGEHGEGRSSGRRIALVGKGITFDSGGISKKPTSGMVTMSTDMAGSATVLAAVLAAARLGLRHTVTAVLPLAENAFGGASYRPGDVVRTLSGTTVEIGNTDAEGRLVLADGMAHAIEVADPEIIVDVATLTGAARIGLGTTHSALFATDGELADSLRAAGSAAGEEAWRLPMRAEAEAALRSDVADVRQTPRGDVHGVGGTIFAAMFLRRFTGGRRWAHLDIAGTGRSTGSGDGLPAGAPTGVGAALLTRWLENLD
ncbi:MAG: leucyl aminopeptidase family protein [Actinomycetaceae bacterium]